MTCRYCLEEDGPFIQPCSCAGSVAHVHEACLNRWLAGLPITEEDPLCPICKSPISTTIPYEVGIFRDKLELNLIYNATATNSIIGNIIYSYQPDFFAAYYHPLQVIWFTGYITLFGLHCFYIKRQREFWTYIAEPCRITLLTLHMFAMLQVIINGSMLTYSAYMWVVCIGHLLLPVTVREMNKAIEMVNAGVKMRWSAE